MKFISKKVVQLLLLLTILVVSEINLVQSKIKISTTNKKNTLRFNSKNKKNRYAKKPPKLSETSFFQRIKGKITWKTFSEFAPPKPGCVRFYSNKNFESDGTDGVAKPFFEDKCTKAEISEHAKTLTAEKPVSFVVNRSDQIVIKSSILDIHSIVGNSIPIFPSKVHSNAGIYLIKNNEVALYEEEAFSSRKKLVVLGPENFSEEYQKFKSSIGGKHPGSLILGHQAYLEVTDPKTNKKEFYSGKILNVEKLFDGKTVELKKFELHDLPEVDPNCVLLLKN